MTDEVTFQCANCGKRPGTISWVGEGGVLDYVHGMYQMWCELCTVEASIEYVVKQMERLPGLRKRLAELTDEDTST